MTNLQTAPRNELPVTVTEVVTIGKINFIVSERFPDEGKDIAELMERLIVKKCGEIA